MEEILKKILSEVTGLKEGQKQLSNEISGINERLNSIENEIRTGENIQMTKAIKNWVEDSNASINCLLLTTASKDSIINLDKKVERIAGDVNFLIRKTTEHEDDIRSLKLAK